MAIKKPIQKPKPKAPPVDVGAIQKSLTALASRLSGKAPRKRGSIVLHATDLGQEIALDGNRIAERSGMAPPLVRISGPSNVLQSIMTGEKEASRAFVAGGIQVSGDLGYLEALLKDLGLLKCG
ncbi:MAG TPA: SCP2 sterol-binding domain-containing protein [Thermoanaerobaculia bacterium]|jgi:hypothetical protein|nr:SCP2 sterol-binding domain-containing protein [Thermoanaerobaculia bacterium]